MAKKPSNAGSGAASRRLTKAVIDKLRIARKRNRAGHKGDVKKPPPSSSYDRRIFIDPKKYPQTAAHIRRAQQKGHPRILTKDSGNKRTVKQRRRDATRPLNEQPRNTWDRDEYPFASTKEGGPGSSVQYVWWKDNQGAGNEIRKQWAGLPQGGRVWVDTYRRPGDPP